MDLPAVHWPSSSGRACSDLGSHTPFDSAPHHCRQVFHVATEFISELINVCSSWSTNFGMSVFRSPQENVTNEFFLCSPAVAGVTQTCFPDGFCDRRQSSVQLFFRGVLLPRNVQDGLEHASICSIKSCFQIFCESPSCGTIE